MAVYLVFTLPDGGETKVHLASKLTVGRGPECDVIISEPGVSTNHALIAIEPDGRILVQDLKSSNGSFKNGAPIKKTYLQVNDVLNLHRVKVRIDANKLSEDERDNIGITKMSDIANEELTLPGLSIKPKKS
jgi:pSer/pThr/pTyr-binding forkhead associated (FHA) protein